MTTVTHKLAIAYHYKVVLYAVASYKSILHVSTSLYLDNLEEFLCSQNNSVIQQSKLQPCDILGMTVEKLNNY